MAEHRIVEHRDTTGSGTGAMLIGLAIVGLLVVVALFFAFGGPGRFVGGPATPNQTNVNVPPQSQPQTAPNINVPRQIDVNVNQQAPAQQPAQQAPAQQQPPAQQPANQQAPAPNR